jgi:hypothetical protein
VVDLGIKGGLNIIGLEIWNVQSEIPNGEEDL